MSTIYVLSEHSENRGVLSGRSRGAVVDESLTDSPCRDVGAEPDASLEHLSPYLYDSLYRSAKGKNNLGASAVSGPLEVVQRRRDIV